MARSEAIEIVTLQDSGFQDNLNPTAGTRQGQGTSLPLVGSGPTAFA